MWSAVTELGPEAPSSDELIRAGRRAAHSHGRPLDPPSFICGFLPPGKNLQPTLDAVAEAWPESLFFGCEAVTQFAGAALTLRGSIQLFWLERPPHEARVTVILGSDDVPPADSEVERAASALAGADAAFVLVDGLRFPCQPFLRRLEARLDGGRPLVVGGLASQTEPITGSGSRVYVGREVLDSALLLVTFHGVAMEAEIVRGWDPASPIYTVTGAAGDELRTIEGETAVDWYRRFFTVHGELAPMPQAARNFPLIVEGPAPERRNLYRSMRAFDDPPGSVTFWGDLQVGDRIRLGMGNDASLLRTAGRLESTTPPEAAVLYSCVGRELVLGGLAAQEVATIHGALRGAALGGFFTFGEIGPPDGGPGLALYNQTAVLALLRELS